MNIENLKLLGSMIDEENPNCEILENTILDQKKSEGMIKYLERLTGVEFTKMEEYSQYDSKEYNWLFRVYYGKKKIPVSLKTRILWSARYNKVPKSWRKIIKGEMTFTV